MAAKWKKQQGWKKVFIPAFFCPACKIHLSETTRDVYPCPNCHEIFVRQSPTVIASPNLTYEAKHGLAAINYGGSMNIYACMCDERFIELNGISDHEDDMFALAR